MSITLSKLIFKHNRLSTQGFIFWPSHEKALVPTIALMTHGYTASKNDLLPWANRLAEEGIIVCLFDLPGHYLGGFNEVESLEDFEQSTDFFSQGLESIKKNFKNYYALEHNFFDLEKITLVLAGHSLGALLALKALNLPAFSAYQKIGIAVGFGHGLIGDSKIHLFETPFFQKTLHLRSQLVSKAIAPQYMFSWIKKEKEKLNLKGQRVHLITGIDDVVVGQEGVLSMKEQLEKTGAFVTLEAPEKLPHHEPGRASFYLKNFLFKNK